MAVQTRDRSERQSTARRRAEQHATFTRCYRVPDGVQVFQPKAGTYTLDIIPYKVSKKKYAASCTWADPGFEHYERTYFNHARIGPNEDAFTCAARTFEKACPICEYRSHNSKSMSQDEAKALNTKERQIFLLYDRGEPSKGLQVWEISYFLFGKLLDSRIKSDKRGDRAGFYFTDDEGRSLEITFEEKQIGQGKMLEAVSIDFAARDKPIPEKVLEKASGVCLDDLVIEVPYDKLKAIFLQEPEALDGDASPNDDDEPAAKAKPSDNGKAKAKKSDPDDNDGDEPDDDDAPKAKVAAKKKPDPDDDDEPKSKKLPTADELGIEEGTKGTYKGEPNAVKRVSEDGTTLTLKDLDDGQITKGVAVGDFKPTKKKPAPKDLDDDDDPKPKAKPAVKKDDDDGFDDD